MKVRREGWTDLVPLLGRRAIVLHGPDPAAVGLSGRDVDCAVDDIDPTWPLRVTAGWRTCQRIHYDLRGWYWVLERDGELIAFDTIDDPLGLGRDGVRTTDLFEVAEVVPPAAMKAAYLTVKRTRKRDLSTIEWTRIAELAAEDPHAYRIALEAIAGEELAALLLPYGEVGSPPDIGVMERANGVRMRRRFGSPGRLTSAMKSAAVRYARRVTAHTGIHVLVAGPDGTGKSTLADALPDRCAGMFKRQGRIHWRPGVLPRPGRLVGKPEADVTKPHARAPLGRATSVALLLYYWADSFVGGWAAHIGLGVRNGLLIVERGWWDIRVDPRRYRLDVPAWLVRGLGALLPHPDLAILLQAPSDVLLDRKRELDAAELDRQMVGWRTALPHNVDVVVVDATASPEATADAAREVVVRNLEERATAQLGAGWWATGGRPPRFWLPRGPRRVALGGLFVHQPVTPRGVTGWRAARGAAAVGLLRLTRRRRGAPPAAVRRMLAPHVPPRGTYAVARANHPGRFVALLLSREGAIVLFAKVATEPEAAARLAAEAAALEELGGWLEGVVRPPRVVAAGEGLLLLEPVLAGPRNRPWHLEPEVAGALGSFFAKGRRSGSVPLGPAHGDVAPWNLVRTSGGWTLLDWESASATAPAFHDVCHFVVQSFSLLDRPTIDEVEEGFRHGTGWIGDAIHAYAEAAELDASTAVDALSTYLRDSEPALRPRTAGERRGLERRRALLVRLGG